MYISNSDIRACATNNCNCGVCNNCITACQCRSLIGPTGPVGPAGPIGPTGPAGPIGPTGPAGFVENFSTTIPFSITQIGTPLATNEQGEPMIVTFAGFGTSNYAPEYLNPGEWAAGIITLRQDMFYGASFIMPHVQVLENIYIVFSSEGDVPFETGSIITPFVALAVSNTATPVYTVLQSTITYTEPFLGGVVYPRHTLKRGSLRNLNLVIPEGTLVAIIAGITGQNVTEEQYGSFSISGGIYLD